MTLTALIVVLGLTGLLLLISVMRNLRRRRLGAAALGTLAAVAIVAVAAGALMVAASLATYRQLSSERPAGQLQFARIGYHQFNGVFTFPSGERSDFALRGDEWQIDARILKWRPLLNVLGFDAAYRLERISGRYASLEEERDQPHTVYALNPPDRLDLWGLLHRVQSWVPGLDAMYGSATFLPMADGALYEISVSPGGLIARPLNQAARAAVAGWR
jgi:hypothetical protein